MNGLNPVSGGPPEVRSEAPENAGIFKCFRRRWGGYSRFTTGAAYLERPVTVYGNTNPEGAEPGNIIGGEISRVMQGPAEISDRVGSIDLFVNVDYETDFFLQMGMFVKLPARLCGGHRDGEKVGCELRRTLERLYKRVTQAAQRIFSKAELSQPIVACNRTVLSSSSEI